MPLPGGTPGDTDIDRERSTSFALSLLALLIGIAGITWLLFPRPQTDVPPPVVDLDRPSRVRALPAVPTAVEAAPPAVPQPPEPAQDPPQVRIVGRVLGGGSHQVAGCPVGEVQATHPDGTFEIRIPLDHSCALRVSRSDGTGVYLGDAVAITGAHDVEVELAPAEQPLSAEEVGTALRRLKVHAEQQVVRLESELATATDANQIMELQGALDQARHQQHRLNDPQEAMVVIEEWAFGIVD